MSTVVLPPAAGRAVAGSAAGRVALETVAAIALGVLAGAVVLLATGNDPVEVYRVLVERAVLRPAGIEESIVRAIPLLLAGVAILVAVRAGAWNIGLDGQVLVAALAAASVASQVSAWPAPLMWLVALVTGAIAGAGWALGPALLRSRFGVNEIVTTIMGNYVALYLTAWLVKGALRDPGLVSPQTTPIPGGMRFPEIADTRVHVGLVLALAVVSIAGWVLRRTVTGFELRVVGANPVAARFARIPVGRYVFGALVASGAVGGLVAANDVLSTKGSFQADWDPGYGLTAFALVFLARRSVAGLIPGALFLGVLSYGGDVMPRAAGIDPAFFGVIEGTILVALAVPALLRARRARREPAGVASTPAPEGRP